MVTSCLLMTVIGPNLEFPSPLAPASIAPLMMLNHPYEVEYTVILIIFRRRAARRSDAMLQIGAAGRLKGIRGGREVVGRAAARSANNELRWRRRSCGDEFAR